MTPLASLAKIHWHPHRFGDWWVILAVIAAGVVIGLAVAAATDGRRTVRRHVARTRLPRAVALPDRRS